jgi:hypothetical protein
MVPYAVNPLIRFGEALVILARIRRRFDFTARTTPGTQVQLGLVIRGDVAVAHEFIEGGDVELVTKVWANQVFANYPVGGTP